MPPLRPAHKLVVAALVAAASSFAGGRDVHAAPFGYISNTDNNTVSVLDTATDSIVATIPIEWSPFGVALPVGQPTAYLLSACNAPDSCASGRVHVLDTATNTVSKVIETGASPSVSLAVNPVMPRIYVASYMGPLAVIDSDTQTLLTNVTVWLFATSVAVHPSGDRAYVVSQGGEVGIVNVLDTATNTIAHTIDIGGPAFGVAFNPGGDRAYFTNMCGDGSCPYAVGSVDVLDTVTETVLTRIQVGEQPRGIVVNAAGTRVYVANAGSQNGGTVSVISTAANAVIDTIPVGPNPWNLALHPDGSKLYVGSYGPGNATVSVIDLGTGDGGPTIPIGSGSQARGTFLAAAIVPDGCGDGITGFGEACDDGNFIDGDGCDHDCTVTACGNGITSPGEECDDGNTVDGDDCSPTCERIGCGDGRITAGEECDDGNVSGADTCSSACIVTPCGDAIVTAGEQCDDGNTMAGDGCDASCRLELIPGGGKALTDCAVEWAVANGTTPPRYDSRGRPSTKQTCRDGDVRCDRDGAANGSCTFGVRLCAGMTDPALGCAYGIDVIHAHVDIRKPSVKEAERSSAAAAIRAQLGVLQGLVQGPPNTCTSTIDMVVPMRVSATGFRKRKIGLKTRVFLGGSDYDSDSLQLTCVP